MHDQHAEGDDMRIELPSDLRDLVREAMARREYATPLDVVREGLHLVEERRRWRDDLESRIGVGLAQIAAGEVHDGPSAVEGLRAEIEERLRREQ
jgi:Arc/MetJ-type ribon-helix-helix transcriptional regulator